MRVYGDGGNSWHSKIKVGHAVTKFLRERDEEPPSSRVDMKRNVGAPSDIGHSGHIVDSPSLAGACRYHDHGCPRGDFPF